MKFFLRFASTAKDVQDGDEQIRFFYYFMDQDTEQGAKKRENEKISRRCFFIKFFRFLRKVSNGNGI